MPTVPEMQNGIAGFINNMKFQNYRSNITISNLLNMCSLASIKNQADENQLRIFPNPFKEEISIKNNKPNYIYELINSSGQIIWIGKQIDKQNFSALTNGLYFLKTYDGNKTYTSKLIKN